MKPMLRLWLIRHGETAWSLSGQHTGRTDLPLTPHGEQMARELAPALAEAAFSLVLTSPRQRARKTCELAGLGAVAQVDPNLAEWDYGDYEGLRTDQIQVLCPRWDVWRHGCPHGEMPADASQRADRVISRLLGFEPQAGRSANVAVFTHGQFGRVLAARWIGMSAFEGQHFALGPASISVLGFEPSHPRRQVIALWNAEPEARQPSVRLL
jgi:probable phosphoglycerate mutase